MQNACIYPEHMSKLLQVRNVPDSVHRRLKAKAASESMSLSEFLLCELKLVAERPTLTELIARIKTRSPVTLSVPPSEALQRERESDS